MAEAVERIAREWTLDDYHRLVRMTLRCGINAALREMERRVVTRESQLIEYGDDDKGNPVHPLDFLRNYTFQFDEGGRVRVVTRRPDAGFFPGGITAIRPFDGELVRIGPGRVMDGFYAIVESPVALPTTDPPKPLSTIVWITAEAQQLKADGKITKSMSKTELAKLLAQRSQGAFKVGKIKKPLTLRYIRNQLEAWGLWPISSIK